MIAILLALLSALCYGTSDFVGGMLSGRLAPWAVAMGGQLAGGAVTLVAAVVRGGTLTTTDLGWAALAGVGSGLGCAFLYRGLASGRMGVVAPISGVGTAVVPVIAGVVGGERPAVLAWLGIVLALPAIWLVAREPGERAGSAAVADGALAGCGFGLSFAALGQVSPDAGLWPVAINLLVAAVAVGIGAYVAREHWLPRGRGGWLTVVPGILGAGALVLFLTARHEGYLTVTAVISALYPAATILLAAVVLHERVHRAQAVGLGLCAAAVTLVAVG
ncbi:EamA family transporter [Nocardioides sp. DS6]|uniref:EamA family transporter n=1 Tax=Nocardioides eburneus TaxID=3231482 RepID=A0ABV3T1I3_9ACTN